MKELEEVHCEIRKVVDFQLSISDRLNNLEDDNGPSIVSQGYDGSDVPLGGFLNDATYAWLSYGCQLVVLGVKSGENISSWTFRDRITCVCQFPAQPGELPLLLVGIDNGATRVKDSMGLLCVFDCATSRVLRAIRMPAGVEQVSIVSGGAEWEEFNDKRPDNVLTDMGGIACVVLRNLHHIMVDLQRPAWETFDSRTVMDESCPAEIEFLMAKETVGRNQQNKDKHAAYNLLNSRIEKHIGFNREEFEAAMFLEGSLTSTVISSTKIGCLISGCLGRVIIWQNDGSVGWISSPIDESTIVTHLALLEPTDDPRPFYYLWVVYQDESAKVPPLLRMYALLFERKYCDRGTNLYFNLEAEPSLKFEFELDIKDKVVSLCTIERESNPDQTDSGTKRGEDNLLLIATTDRTLLFDLNQWYKEQMPQAISECQNPNSIFASYRTKSRAHNTIDNQTVSCTYIPCTLQEFPNNGSSSSDELFYPNSLSLEWVELSLTKLTFWMSRGIQVELLRKMAMAGPIILTQPSETFHKCLSVGLVPFNTDVSFTSDHNTQREMLLSLCLEQRWATFLVRCAKEWSDGSASYLYPSFLKWGVQRASSIKMIADRLCVPLFDQSGSNIGEAEVKTLRFCSQQLECLSNVVAKLPLTSDLVKQRRALKRVSTYLQVLLWFYDVRLLPETQDLEEGPLPISLALKIPYPFEKLYDIYKEKRTSFRTTQEKDENEEGLFIDELITRECPLLKLQWEREGGDNGSNGYYPPPSLQSLLRSYLADCHQTEFTEIECKHQITIYLLMDLAMLLQGSYPSVDQLIKYPSAFKMSPSLIKLTQAFWLLDHEDYQGFLDMMTGQLVSDSDVKDWHHKLVLRTLVRNNQHKLALHYLRIRKPPLSSVEDQSTLISLSVEHGLVQSAFHRRPQSHYAQLLICFFQACKTYDKLGEILHLALDTEEEEVFVKFLENDNSVDTRLLYYIQRCRYTEANTGNSAAQYNVGSSKNNQTVSMTMLNAYNATLPDVIKRFSVNMAKNNMGVDIESRYPRPMSHYKSCNKSLNIHETVIRKAKETFLRSEKSQIPFISAPCTSLKTNDTQVNVNCALFPQLAQRNRSKRTLDQMYEDEDSELKQPDGAKRRKLVDDGEGSNTSEAKEMSFNMTFNTPLVKRKNNVSSNKDAPAETPHSILKIRQMIRNSTSPSIGSSQTKVLESPVVDREKKINRQIRFSIGQSKKTTSHKELNGEESSVKINVSGESEDAFFSPNISIKSQSESAILSDSSCSSKHVYSPRPRPSLRRTSLQSSKESICELSHKPSTLEDSTSTSKLVQTPRTRNSLLSASIYSPAVLTPSSSFEASVTSRRSGGSKLQQSLKFLGKEGPNLNSAISSTPLTKNYVTEKPYSVEEDAMEVEEMEEVVSEYREEDPEETNLRLQLDDEDEVDEEKETEGKYKNGDIALYEQEEVEEELRILSDKEEEENEEAFESLESSQIQQERDFFSWSQREDAKDRRRSSIGLEKSVTLGNGDNVDITDDESSNSADEAPLAHEESSDRVKLESETKTVFADNMYDASNITEDESDSSMDTEALDAEDRNAEKTRDTSKDSLTTGVGSNAMAVSKKPLATPRKSFREAESAVVIEKDSPSERKEETTARGTRTRRASSIAKEAIALLSSPSKSATAEKPRTSRRASSLAKEVLTASAIAVEEGVKNTMSPSLDTSIGTSSPRSNRTRRASSIAKETAEETEAKVPIRRSSRRAASVQKDLPEVTKSPAKSNRVTSTSGVTSDNEEDQEVKSKTTRTRNASSKKKSTAASSTRSTRTSKSQVDKEEPEETIVKPARRRSSSVPKDVAVEVPRTRRSSSVAKETVSEDLELPQETIRRRNSTTNTRSRRSSIQSIPEELEEILSVPTKERISNVVERKNSSRLRRATSMELSQVETKRKTRSARGRSILEETIVEEDVAEVQEQPEVESVNVKKVPTRRNRTTSDASTQEVVGTPTKTRRGRKTIVNQETKNQYSFSQPEERGDPPVDQKAIEEVPSYVFSPPHTRSKTITPDQYRRLLLPN